jgi:predicted Fe-Mo cluster-binding NifX family protein
MKVAITAKGKTLADPVDPRFGRAPYILVVDTDTREVKAIDNSPNVKAFKGAGIQAATTVSEAGAQVLLTGYCGPNAFRTLQAAGLKVVCDIAGTVEDVVDSFQAGKLPYTEEPNTDGHW